MVIIMLCPTPPRQQFHTRRPLELALLHNAPLDLLGPYTKPAGMTWTTVGVLVLWTVKHRPFKVGHYLPTFRDWLFSHVFPSVSAHSIGILETLIPASYSERGKHLHSILSDSRADCHPGFGHFSAHVLSLWCSRSIEPIPIVFVKK